MGYGILKKILTISIIGVIVLTFTLTKFNVLAEQRQNEGIYFDLLSQSITTIHNDPIQYISSNYNNKLFNRIIKNVVTYPEKVQINEITNHYKTSRLPFNDTFDHVIITSDSNAPYYEPLVEWHTKRGLKDTVVTTEYIYRNYYGLTNQERIRNFIIYAHQNWGTQFFLLGGEHSTVPFEYRTYYEESTPSDQYYSDYDDDWVHEVFVGRSTAEGETEITRFINKVLKYEKDPPSDYLLNVTLLGTGTDFISLEEGIYNENIPSFFSVTKIYTPPGDPRLPFIDVLNEGQNLVNQGEIYSCIDNLDVDNLTNYNRTCIVFSTTCYGNEMDINDCLGEHFVIYNDWRAGVAFIGNTRDGIFLEGQPEELTGGLDKEFWKSLFFRNEYILGETFVDAKHYFSTSSPYQNIKEHCEWTLNLLGDPAMPIWTDIPKSFNVTHSTTIYTETQLFTVHVENISGFPVEDAYVSLWKDDEIYERGYTNTYGDITLSILPETSGDMYVTVSKHNYLSYEGISNALICGNLNRDGNINIADLTYLVAYLFGGGPSPIPSLCVGDLNGDGIVNVADMTYIISYLYGGGPVPVTDCCG